MRFGGDDRAVLDPVPRAGTGHIEGGQGKQQLDPGYAVHGHRKALAVGPDDHVG